MLHHLSIGVSDLAKSRAFYDAVLDALGFARFHDEADAIGYGDPIGQSFWLARGTNPVPRQAGSHIAFTAGSRAAVDAFHRAALAAGGVDNGRPGLRAEYAPNYYAAFAIDRDGHRIEAVCLDPV